jgi:hypothetical protein
MPAEPDDCTRGASANATILAVTTARHPEDTGERRVAGWQRALRWVAWLTFLGLAIKNSQSVYFSPLEWLALAAAIGISIWCLAKPLGAPKMEMAKPTHPLGAFVSRTSWGLVCSA